MAGIIVRQANATSLTVQASSNQVLVRQQPNNTVVVQTTGNSYVLPPATANTLGGIIVGDNLTINANGLLSAQAGGVSTFNNRTGNVTLTANDVTTIANDLYAKESNQTRINFADGLVPASNRGVGPVNNISYSFYGAISNQTSSGNPFLANGTHTNFIGFHTNNGVDRPYIGKWHRATSGNETQTAVYLENGVNFYSTAYQANSSIISDVYFYTTTTALTFGVTGPIDFAGFDMSLANGFEIYGVAKAINNLVIAENEVLTKSGADRLYEKIVRRN
jgi:hypothetical protein